MKYLLRALFILALFCGFTSHARANGFHATVLDPSGDSCLTSDNNCTIYDTSTFSVQLSSAECVFLNIGDGSATNGCFLGINGTGETITSLSLVFSDAEDLGSLTCDNADNPPGLPSPIFSNPTCSETGPPYTLAFIGGDGVAPGGDFIIFEDGALPEELGTGTGVVGITPEPEPLLLLSTGVMMMAGGLYLTKRQHLSAFVKK
jgi:hypothetical protein